MYSNHTNVHLFKQGGYCGTYNEQFQSGYEVSNVYTSPKLSGWLLKGSCFPQCDINATISSSNINDVFGGYNPNNNQVILLHRFSNAVWGFDPDTLQYTTIIPNNSLDISMDTTVKPLYVTINNTIYFWGSTQLDQGYGIRCFNMDTYTYSNPELFGNDDYLSVYHHDNSKCMTTDGLCILFILDDDLINPYLFYVNLCDTQPHFDATSNIILSESLEREEFSCLVKDNKLYIIGGGSIVHSPNGKVFYTIKHAIKYIDISNIIHCVYNNTCNSLDAIVVDAVSDYDLNVRRFSAQALLFDDSILIIAGYNGFGYKYSSEIMDFRLGKTILAPHELILHHDISLSVLAKKDNKPAIFIFGGVHQARGALEQCVVGK